MTRKMAYVESADGVNMTANGTGGIWQVSSERQMGTEFHFFDSASHPLRLHKVFLRISSAANHGNIPTPL